jgi:hypothetical protein
MKEVSLKSKVLLISMSRFLVQFIELANRIPEEDYKRIVLIAQKCFTSYPVRHFTLYLKRDFITS